MSIRDLTLVFHPGRFAAVRLPASDSLPAWATAGSFVSITRDRLTGELSIICPEQDVPIAQAAERGWVCLRVAGPLPFDAVGVVSALVQPLAKAEIPVLAISSYDTDYLLVRAASLKFAIATLRGAGHCVEGCAEATEIL